MVQGRDCHELNSADCCGLGPFFETGAVTGNRMSRSLQRASTCLRELDLVWFVDTGAAKPQLIRSLTRLIFGLLVLPNGRCLWKELYPLRQSGVAADAVKVLTLTEKDSSERGA